MNGTKAFAFYAKKLLFLTYAPGFIAENHGRKIAYCLSSR
jgi:hypothetical protein